MAEAMAEDQQASNLQSTGEDPDVEDVEAYSFADEYWKEYLNDVARKKVMQSLVSGFRARVLYESMPIKTRAH